MSASAAFQQRKANRRRTPGKLFYPSEASHVFEKYWDHLSCLDRHQDFSSESPYCQQHMRLFSEALAAMRHKSFIPKPAADAKQVDVEIAEDASLSRLLPIQDGPDQWEIHGSSVGQRSDSAGRGTHNDYV
jgi:hypothetical protein